MSRNEVNGPQRRKMLALIILSKFNCGQNELKLPERSKQAINLSFFFFGKTGQAQVDWNMEGDPLMNLFIQLPIKKDLFWETGFSGTG